MDLHFRTSVLGHNCQEVEFTCEIGLTANNGLVQYILLPF